MASRALEPPQWGLDQRLVARARGQEVAPVEHDAIEASCGDFLIAQRREDLRGRRPVRASDPAQGQVCAKGAPLWRDARGPEDGSDPVCQGVQRLDAHADAEPQDARAPRSSEGVQPPKRPVEREGWGSGLAQRASQGFDAFGSCRAEEAQGDVEVVRRNPAHPPAGSVAATRKACPNPLHPCASLGTERGGHEEPPEGQVRLGRASQGVLLPIITHFTAPCDLPRSGARGFGPSSVPQHGWDGALLPCCTSGLPVVTLAMAMSLSPMGTVHRLLAPSLHDALDALAEALRARRALGRSLFSPPLLLVASRLLGVALERDLAERLGGTADLRVATWAVEADRWLARLEGAFLDEHQIRDRLAVLLTRLASRTDPPRPEWASWWAWLRGEPGDPSAIAERAGGLAIRLAALFARYEWERPRMVQAWLDAEGGTGLQGAEALDPERGEAAKWQRALWRCVHGLSSALDPEGAEPELAFEPAASRVAFLARGPASSAPPPAEEIWLLAPSAWPELLGEVVTVWAAQARVHVVLLEPSEDPQWLDALRTGRDLRAQLAEAGALHPLLLRWGASLGAVREAALVSVAAEGRSEEAASLRERVRFLPPRARPLEGPARPGMGPRALRAWVRASFVRDPGRPPCADASFVRVAAHDIRREVEWAAERIWRWMREASERGEPLRLERVGLLLAARDRGLYQALVEQIFPRAHGGDPDTGGIPFVLVERPLLEGSRAGQALSRLLELPLHVPTRPRWLDVLTHPFCLATEPDAETEAWVRLLDATGMLHGLDAADHRDTHLGTSGPHVEQALLRLALGQLLSGERLGEPGRFDWPGRADALWVEEGGEAARSLLGVLSVMAAAVRVARCERRSLAQWARFAEGWARRVLRAPPGERAEEGVLERLFDELRAVGEGAGSASVPYRVFCTMAMRRLEGLQIVDGRAPLGGVQVGSFRRLCRLPFQHVIVLGLAEREMPAAVAADPIDLRRPLRGEGQVPLGGAPRHQEPAVRDQQAFLELLLGPSRSLAFCWPAVEPHSGEPVPPSSLLVDLAGWLERSGVSWPLLRTRRRRWEEPASGEGANEEAERLGEPPEHVHEGVVAERRAARWGARLRGQGGLLETTWMQARAAARLRAEGRAAWLVGAASSDGVPLRTPSSMRELSVGRLARFVHSPVQAWAAETLGMEASFGEPAEAREEEPFAVASWQAIAVLSESLRAAVEAGWSLERALARYEEQASRARGRGRWPFGPLAEAAARVHCGWLRAWVEAGARAMPDPEVRGLLLGSRPPGLVEEGAPGRVLPPLSTASGSFRLVGDLGWEVLVGGAEPRLWIRLLSREGGVRGPGGKDFHRARREALRQFVCHLAACAVGEGGDRTLRLWFLPCEVSRGVRFWEVRYRMTDVAVDVARAALDRWAEAVTGERFPGRAPASLLLEALGGKKKPLPMCRLADRLPRPLPYVPEGGERDAGGLGSDRFGPFPEWLLRQLPPPSAEALHREVRERLALFLRHVVEVAADDSGAWHAHIVAEGGTA